MVPKQYTRHTYVTASCPRLSASSSSASFQTSALPPHPGAQPRVLALPIARARRRRHRAGRAAASIQRPLAVLGCIFKRLTLLAFKAGHRCRIDLQVNLPAGHLAEHHTICEETGPAEHAAYTDSAERLEQVVDKFSIHNFCVSSRSVCYSATLQGINPLRLSANLVDLRGLLARNRHVRFGVTSGQLSREETLNVHRFLMG